LNDNTAYQIDTLTSLATSCTGSPPDSIVRLKGDASKRAIYRIRFGDDSLIGIYGPDKAENTAFLGFSETFKQLDLPVPGVYAVDESGLAYLLEDLGDTTLFEYLEQQRNLNGGKFPYKELRPLYREAVAQLTRFQLLGADNIDYSLCYQHAEFNDEAWRFDHNYFVTCFVKSLLPDSVELYLIEIDLAQHRSLLKSANRSYFLYRDFQSRNIMVTSNGLHFIDYQSGRRGAVSYDIASLLYDGRANLPQEIRDELLELHINLIAGNSKLNINELRSDFTPYALMRVLQALGAYGNLGILQGKREYVKGIPFGLRNALYLINSDDRLTKLAALHDILNQIQSEKRWELYEH